MTVKCLRRDEIATKKDYDHLLKKGEAYEGDKVIVDPLPSEEELGEDPCGIPIRLGDHWIRLMAKDRKIERSYKLRIEPFESVLVISMEYIALPRDKMAIILPRARAIQHGLLIHTTRVHPTWHGKLAFVIVNLSRRPIVIEPKAQIASMVVFETEKGGALPSREDLGRESLDVDLRRLAKEPAQPKDVIIELEEDIRDIRELVKKYGPPFNTIAESIEKRFEEMYEEIRKVLKEISKELRDEVEEKVESKVEKEINNRIRPSVNTWMSSIFVLVLTLAIALIQITQATLKTNNTMTNLDTTSTPHFGQYIDQISLLITKIVLPLAMVANLIILALILLNIWRLTEAQNSSNQRR